jgi:hypothetical protein
VGSIYGFIGSFVAEWRLNTRSLGELGLVVIQVPVAVAVAWVASRSADPTILAYVMVGVPRMLVWEHSAFYAPLAFFRDIWDGTAEMALVTQTSMTVAILGKALSVSAFSATAGLAVVPQLRFGQAELYSRRGYGKCSEACSRSAGPAWTLVDGNEAGGPARVAVRHANGRGLPALRDECSAAVPVEA